MNKMTQANKKGWDGLAETHYKNYHIDKLISGTPLINELIREEVGDVRGKSLVHGLLKFHKRLHREKHNAPFTHNCGKA